MSQLLPHRFLFRYSLPVGQVKLLPRKGKRLLNLTKSSTLPDFAELDGGASFGELRLAWNERGIGISVHVSGKQQPLECRLNDPTESDGLQVWIDTRNTQNIHRASRFCHQFCLLPEGAGRNGKQPSTIQLPIARAREEASSEHAGAIQTTARIDKGGYLLEAWIPAAALHGFDAEASRQLGFYYSLRDAELGEQYLSVGPEFPFAQDPSLWATLELVD